MLIPKCCKGCSGRKNGMCNCTLPSYCNEWVEDDETHPTDTCGVINTPNTVPSDIKIGDPYPCGSDGTYPDNKKEWYDFKPTYEQGIGDWANCKDKDHRIAVLEKAIYLLAYYTPCDRCPIGKYKCKGGQDCENQLKQYFIKQAEKELGEKGESK